jgi:hypothetical protein
VGRPLLAAIAFASLVVLGLPVAAATYTRDSANPLAWRNLSLYEVQGKLDYCLQKPTLASLSACDYGHVKETGGLSPRKVRIERVVVLMPYPVAGPIIVDGGGQAAAAPVKAAGRPQDGGDEEGGQRAARSTPVPGNFPVIKFPAGPLSAIEATCASAKKAAAGQSAAYLQDIGRQCEAAKQTYERTHGGG